VTIDERLERLVERHEALTQSVELLASTQSHAAEEYEERFLRQEERFLRQEERLLEIAERADAHREQHNREITEIRRELGRAIRLSIQEARNQRNRHQELEVLMKAFLERGGNGKASS
jgi:hypothetical protein